MHTLFGPSAWLIALALAPAMNAQNAGGRGGGASWVAVPDAPAREYGVYHFRRTFELDRKPAAFVVNVSADNRYKLYVNGEEAAVGPARGDLRNWRYDPLDIARYLHAGRNTLAAVVWNFAEMAPVAQITSRTGFLVEGASPAERIVDTGPNWKCVRDLAYDRLREVARAPDSDDGVAAAREEKRLLQARRAVAKAIRALAPGSDDD